MVRRSASWSDWSTYLRDWPRRVVGCVGILDADMVEEGAAGWLRGML